MDFNDWHAIYSFVHRYPACADRGDFDAVGAIHGDATVKLKGHSEPFFKAEGPQQLHGQTEADAAQRCFHCHRPIHPFAEWIGNDPVRK